MTFYGYFMWFVLTVCAGGFALAAADYFNGLRKRVRP